MLPEQFKVRMKELLGDEYDALEAALSEPNVRGIRVNETKIAKKDFLNITSLRLEEIS